MDWLRNLFAGGSDAAQPAPRPLPPAPAPQPTLPPPVPAAAPPAEPAVDDDDPLIPRAAKKRVATIRRMIDELTSRAAAKGGLVQERLELDQIKTLHLPRLLTSYIEIPPQHRAEIFRATGRSASFMLTERLDRIIERLTEISKMLAQNDLDAFAANIRFIDTRYGEPGAADRWD